MTASKTPGVTTSMTLTVTVVYCPSPNEVWQTSLCVPETLTVAQTVSHSGLLQAHPALNARSLSVGIFGQTCLPGRQIKTGDRIEVYRPLTVDPMQSRRRRAALRLAQTQKEKADRKARAQFQPTPE